MVLPDGGVASSSEFERSGSMSGRPEDVLDLRCLGKGWRNAALTATQAARAASQAAACPAFMASSAVGKASHAFG